MRRFSSLLRLLFAPLTTRWRFCTLSHCRRRRQGEEVRASDAPVPPFLSADHVGSKPTPLPPTAQPSRRRAEHTHRASAKLVYEHPDGTEVTFQRTVNSQSARPICNQPSQPLTGAASAAHLDVARGVARHVASTRSPLPTCSPASLRPLGLPPRNAHNPHANCLFPAPPVFQAPASTAWTTPPSPWTSTSAASPTSAFKTPNASSSTRREGLRFCWPFACSWLFAAPPLLPPGPALPQRILARHSLVAAPALRPHVPSLASPWRRLPWPLVRRVGSSLASSLFLSRLRLKSESSFAFARPSAEQRDQDRDDEPEGPHRDHGIRVRVRHPPPGLRGEKTPPLSPTQRRSAAPQTPPRGRQPPLNAAAVPLLCCAAQRLASCVRGAVLCAASAQPFCALPPPILSAPSAR